MFEDPENPFFSVVVPTYNRASIIGDCMNSVVSQLFKNWELIVIDDGSTDDTGNEVHKIVDRRIRYFKIPRSERSAARNFGVSKSKGQYICFLDSDDYFKPCYLGNLFNRIGETAGVQGIFLGGVEYVNSRKEVIKQWCPLPDLQHQLLVIYILKNRLVVPTISICAHKSILESIKFDERFSLWEDTHLAMRMVADHAYFPFTDNYVCALLHDKSTVGMSLSEVKMSDVVRYADAITSLVGLPYANHFSQVNRQYFLDYLQAKYQLYIYQAFINKQHGIVLSILKLAFNNSKSLGSLYYYIKTLVKVFIQSSLRIDFKCMF